MSAPKLAGRRIRHGRKALVLAAMVTAGCGAATSPAAGTVPATAARPAVLAAVPALFAGTLVPTRDGTAWPVGVFSSATGQLLRQLTAPPAGASNLVLAVRGGWVYFAAWRRPGLLSGVWRVPLAGGPARLVQAGAITYVLSPDGRMAASLVDVDYGRTETSAGGRLAWRSTIWRWSGGPPVRVRTLPPVTQPPAGYELTDIAW